MNVVEDTKEEQPNFTFSLEDDLNAMQAGIATNHNEIESNESRCENFEVNLK